MVLPLDLIAATHVRVTCDLCGSDARMCPKRWQEERGARELATHAFQKIGWYLDVKDHPRQRIYDDYRREGHGKWYCPNCAKKKHM